MDVLWGPNWEAAVTESVTDDVTVDFVMVKRCLEKVFVSQPEWTRLQQSTWGVAVLARRVQDFKHRRESLLDRQTIITGPDGLLSLLAEVDLSPSVEEAIRLVAGYVGGDEFVQECCPFGKLWDKRDMLRFIAEASTRPVGAARPYLRQKLEEAMLPAIVLTSMCHNSDLEDKRTLRRARRACEGKAGGSYTLVH